MNAPAFVEALDVHVDVPHVGIVSCDVAWGSGTWYAVVDIHQPALESTISSTLDPSHAKQLCQTGERIKFSCREQHPARHPLLDYPGVDILVFVQAATATTKRGIDDDDDDDCINNNTTTTSTTTSKTTWYSCNTVVMSNTSLVWGRPEAQHSTMFNRSPCAMLDRSPCGTGTCAVMAVRHAGGQMK